MGKKRRILTNPKKFGRKHFNFLDSVDGTKDGVIASSKIPLTIRTLNLTDLNDRTISLNAELFGTGTVDSMMYKILMTGGILLETPVIGKLERLDLLTGAAGTITAGRPAFSSSLPAIQDDAGNPFVFPVGMAKVVAAVDQESDFSSPGFASITLPTDAAAYLEQEVRVGAAQIGLSSDNLLANLNTGSDDSGKLSFNTAGFTGTGPQHGSGSGVGSSQVYSTAKGAAGPGHGFVFTLSGSLTGSLKLSDHGGTATTDNRHTSDTVTLLQSSSVAALDPQTLKVTFTPLDVNGAESSDDAVSTTISVPFVIDDAT